MKKAFFLLLSTLFFASCSSDKKDLITRKWQAIKVDNPQQDAFFKEQELFIDTFGKNNDAATNISIYGFSNVDSARESLKAQMKDYKAMQQHSIENTWFDFKNNGKVFVNFSGQLDTVSWEIDKDGNLALDDKNQKNSSIKMQIVELSKSALKLRIKSPEDTSTVSFVPAKK